MSATDEAITKLTTAMETAIKTLGTLGEKYGPEVVDAALSVIRINGAANVFQGLVALAVAVVAFKYGRSLLVRGNEISRTYWLPSTPSSAPSGTPQQVSGVVLLVASGVGALAAFFTLTNIWHLVAIFEPKLWVAKRLLGL